jgi:tetratricopeptide (TPR) repeat protein
MNKLRPIRLVWRKCFYLTIKSGKLRAYLLTITGCCAAVMAVYQLLPPPEESIVSPPNLLQAVDARDVRGIERLIGEVADDPARTQELIFLRGARNLFLNHPTVALQEFSKIQPVGPLRIPVLTLTGESLYRVGQLRDAERCLQMVVLEAPETANGHRWLAAVYYDLGTMDRALHHLLNVSKRVPDDPRPHRMRGVIFHDFGDYERAASAFQQAADLTRDQVALTDILVSLAAAQTARNQFQLASETLSRCVPNGVVLSAQANCAWDLGLPDEADELLKRAERIGLLPGSGLRLKARMLLESGEAEAAIAVLEPLLTANHSDDEAEYLLAMAHQQLGNDTLHARHLEHSEELKDLKTELTRLSQQAMKQPNNAQVRQEMAVVCEKLGLEKMAQVWRAAAVACQAANSGTGTTP